jgi:hypothetical protein
MLVLPWLLRELIAVMPEIVENCFLERRRDRRGHRVGVGARQVGVDLDGRVVDRRQIGDRQLR